MVGFVSSMWSKKRRIVAIWNITRNLQKNDSKADEVANIVI